MNSSTLPDPSSILDEASGFVEAVANTIADTASSVDDNVSHLLPGAHAMALPIVTKSARFAAKRPKLVLQLGVVSLIAYFVYKRFIANSDNE